MNWRNLIIRGVAGIVYVALLLFGILYSKYAFIVVFGLILVLALNEFYRLVENKASLLLSKIFNIIFGVAIFLSTFLYLEGKSLIALPIFSLLYLLSLFVSAVLINRGNTFNTVIYSAFGQLYITLPLSLLQLILFQPKVEYSAYYYCFVLAIFIFIWLNDTFAFITGVTLGKHKLLERISPKKTIEGFVGGVLFTMLAGVGFSFLCPDYSILFWLGFALIVSLFGTLGDLFESLIKRSYNVKDSGHIIPGHGGILDRIDSLLFVIPAIYLYLLITNAFI